jgi:hypothetical protein
MEHTVVRVVSKLVIPLAIMAMKEFYVLYVLTITITVSRLNSVSLAIMP